MIITRALTFVVVVVVVVIVIILDATAAVLAPMMDVATITVVRTAIPIPARLKLDGRRVFVLAGRAITAVTIGALFESFGSVPDTRVCVRPVLPPGIDATAVELFFVVSCVVVPFRGSQKGRSGGRPRHGGIFPMSSSVATLYRRVVFIHAHVQVQIHRRGIVGGGIAVKVITVIQLVCVVRAMHAVAAGSSRGDRVSIVIVLAGA